MKKPNYDVVIFGASSFIGALLTEYLVDYFAQQEGHTRWAIAGRNEEKLRALRTALGQPTLPIIVADINDAASLDALCQQTRAVVSTVGPYALYGELMVRACAESGTDYCDLAGEVHWVKRMIDRYQSVAEQTGARLIPSCGFDSVPSDMGVFHLQQQALTQFGEPAQHIKMRIHELKVGASGGSILSVSNLVKEALSDGEVRAVMQDPYAISPANHGFTAKQHQVALPEKTKEFGAWSAAFLMASINEGIVRRSHALTPALFQPEFTYDEGWKMGTGLLGMAKAVGLTAGIGGMLISLGFPPSRYVLERFVLPKAGEGPNEKQLKAGRLVYHLVGTTASGRRLKTAVIGEGDPGYYLTSRMLGHAVLSLVHDQVNEEGEKNTQGGFWTTASLLGGAYLTRLQNTQEMRFVML